MLLAEKVEAASLLSLLPLLDAGYEFPGELMMGGGWWKMDNG